MFLLTDSIRFSNLFFFRLPHRSPDRRNDWLARVRRPCSSSAFALLLVALLSAAPAHAQVKTTVHVETAKAEGTIYTTSIGIAADRWDAKAFDEATVKLLKDAGITMLRFPGNNGVAGLYHWSTGSITNPYTNDRAPAFAPERKFPAIVPVIDDLGTGLVAVNYGSNLDGSGGGEPAEAAAWVAYANGKTDNKQAIGKDSKGNDWKTVGYWASLRASSPLPTDDGLNALRIMHLDPIGIQLWTVGNEPYYNGFYGQDHTPGSDADSSGLYGQAGSPEADLHAGSVPTSRDWGRHLLNAKVGPQAYGAAVVDFVKAMKAVDPTIFVGAFLTMPLTASTANDPNPLGKNWNAGVLKAACASMDFSAITLVEGKGAPPNWVDNVDEEDLLKAARDPLDVNSHFNMPALYHDYALLAADLTDKYKKFCPAGHSPQLAITVLAVQSWLPAKNPAAVGLFAADAMATLIERGAYTVDWSPVHAPSPSFLDKNNQPQPAYYAIKLLHQTARVGDQFVAASSPTDSLAVHAVKRRDGGLGLLLINKDSNQSLSVTVTVDGYSYATKGRRYDWGKPGTDPGKDITESPIENLGGTFTVVVPRYSITAIVVPKA